MNGTPFWDRVFKTASWIIVAALLISSYTVMFVALPGNTGPVGSLIGATGAKFFYFFLYLGEALVLAYSKVYKRNKLRKHALVAVYSTGAFTSILTLVNGWSPKVIDNLVFTFVSAGCWLYWKFKTEYVTSEEFARTYQD